MPQPTKKLGCPDKKRKISKIPVVNVLPNTGLRLRLHDRVREGGLDLRDLVLWSARMRPAFHVFVFG